MTQSCSCSFFSKYQLGDRPSQGAINRFKQNFKTPRQLLVATMPQTRERVDFQELFELEPHELSIGLLQQILTEITFDITTYDQGRNADSILATEWFYFLLPYLIDRGHEKVASAYFTESLIAAAIATKISVNQAGYENFESDLLCTIGQIVMSPFFWQNKRLKSSFVDEQLEIWEVVPACSGLISAWIYFNLFFLKTNQINDWVKSMLDIEDPFWKANLLAWLAASGKLKCREPFKIPSDYRLVPCVTWENVGILRKSRIRFQEAHLDTFFDSIRQYIDVERMLSWTTQFKSYPNVSEWFTTARLCDSIADGILHFDER
jgi:hypothetical protein